MYEKGILELKLWWFGGEEKDKAKKTFKIIHYFHGNANIQILGRLIGLEISLDNG